MKEKIEQLAKGKFEYQLPQLLLSEEKLTIRAEAGKQYQGSFHISNSSGRRMKGVLYSDSCLLTLKKNQFIGEEAEISYLFHGEYTKAGEKHEGNLQLITDVGELTLPYEIQVSLPCIQSSIGDIRDFFQFTNLAKENREEAEQLFFHENFVLTMFGRDRQFEMLYQTMKASSQKKQALEEFLIAIGKKMPFEISLEQSSFHYEAGSYNFMDKLVLHKTGWGQANYQIRCEADFLELERTSFSADDFVNNRLELGFVVKTAGMKAGIHSGRIEIQGVRQQFLVEVTCRLQQRQREYWLQRNKLRHAMLELTRNYLCFRSGQKNAGQYTADAGRLLTVFRQEELPDTRQELLVRLYQIHIWQAEGKDSAVKNALSLLSEKEKEEQTAALPELQGGLAYLNAMQKKPVLSTESAAQIVKELYQQNPEQWLLLWYLLYLDRACHDRKTKYDAIRTHANGKNTSPVLLFEALSVLREEPSLLRCLEPFELRLLQFAVDYHYLNDGILEQLAVLAGREKTMPALLYRILTSCYQQKPGRELLQAICTLIIRNGDKSRKYFPWLKLGVEEQLRITDLMEYYLYCMEENPMEDIHPNVYLYFSYHNEMIPRKRALLYASLILHKQSKYQLYQDYRREMEEFAVSQMRAGSNSSNLAVLYDDIFEEGLPPQNSQYLPQIVFTWQVTCSKERFKSICVRHRGMARQTVVPLIRGNAFINLYTEEAAIFLIDEEGCYYPIRNFQIKGAAEECVSMKKLVHLEQHLWQCYEEGCTELPLLLYLEEQASKYQKYSGRITGLYKKISEQPDVSEEQKNLCSRMLMEHYYDNFESELFEYYLQQVKVETLNQADRAKVVNLLLLRNFDRAVYPILTSYGVEEVDIRRLSRFVSRQLHDHTEQETDEALLRLAYYVFDRGKYDTEILEYLSRYYHGATNAMYEIWKAAKNEELDTEALEESLLGQMLFAESYIGNAQSVFMSYYCHGTNHKLIRAYLSYYACKYLTRDRMISQELFDIMEREAALEENEVCTLALMKNYSTMEQLTERQIKFIDYKMFRLQKKGILLPFFQKFEGIVKLPEEMYDKQYVEYRTNPANKVTIHYLIGDEEVFHEQEMKDVCYGIFVRSFVLFEGETLQYYITEEQDGKETITESTAVTADTEVKEGGNSKFDRLNLILMAHQMQEEATVLSLLEKYILTEYETEHLFQPIE